MISTMLEILVPVSVFAILVYQRDIARNNIKWLRELYEGEVLSRTAWQEDAHKQEELHKAALNREMQYRLALDNVVNMNQGDPAFSIWVRQYAATILSRVK